MRGTRSSRPHAVVLPIPSPLWRGSTDDALRTQPLSVVLTIAQSREHLIRMLTQAWAQVPDTPWRVAQFQNHASLLHYLTSGAAVGEQHLTVLHLRVSEDFGGRVHRTDADI